jgi:beta-glucosidase
VLFGAAEPGGRLPVVWPAAEGPPIPSTRPVDGVLTYAESFHIGQRAYDRAGIAPAYPFGHGLGYTSWEYLEVTEVGGGVRVRVRNTGRRAGREVVQVYASRPDSGIERPSSWLVGFTGVTAQPGEEVLVEVPLAVRAFQHWDAGTWRLEPGEFRLAIGRSAADVRLTTAYSPT